jgi:uncharacterized membrane protein (DUF2068 family)
MRDQQQGGKAGKGKRKVGLVIIAFGKLIQVLLVLAAGAAALIFVNHVPPESLAQWANATAPQSNLVQGLVDKVLGTDNKTLAIFGKASFAYAALFAVEGLGLWFEKRWAEYLTVIVTGSLIPFEIYGLTQEFSTVKLVTLIVNGAVVVYLTVRLVVDRSRQEERPS